LTNVGQFWYHSVVIVINLAEAKAQLSQLAARASQGEEIILARHGQPIARLMPLEDVVPAATCRGFGIGRDMFDVHDDFDNPLPADLLDAFEGNTSGR